MRTEQSTMSNRGGEFAPSLFRGKVLEVIHPDLNSTRQTLCSLFMFDQLPVLQGVPVVASKANARNGEQATPEVGDLVLVGFIGGQMRDPVVIGFLPIHDNPLQASSEEAPHYRKVQSGTSETIRKDGSREVYVAKDEILIVKGSGTVTIQEGDLSLEVTAGAATVNIHGNATIHSDADVTVSADGAATVTGDSITVTSSGNVSITGTGTVTAASTGAMSLSSSAGSCSISGTAMNIQSSGTVSIASSGQVNISGTNVAITA